MEKLTVFLHSYLGFSWKGWIAFLLPMLPNILFFILPNPNASKAAANSHFLDTIEHVSQAVFFMLLIFGTSKKESPILCTYTIFMAILLLSYYAFWIIYFTTGANSIILMLMAIFPVAYFVLAEIWLHNYPAFVPLTIFGIVHIIITYINAYLS